MTGSRRAWPLTVVLTLVIAACTASPAGDAPDPNGELTTFLSADPGNTDPQRAGFIVQVEQIHMVYEGLLKPDPRSLRPVPAAAREMPTVSADGKTYRFRLRDGLTYSDGVPLTAGDFAYGLGRLCDPAIRDQPSAGTAYVIVGCQEWHSLDVAKSLPERYAQLRAALFARGIRVASGTELELTLTAPASYFLAYLATWVGMPVRERDVTRGGLRWWSDPSLYVGNGPFVLSERVQDERLVFTANPRARVQPKLRKWTKLILPESAVQLSAYRHGESDRHLPTPDQIAAIEQDPSLKDELLTNPTACTHFVRFNALRVPFDDPKVRLAFAKSLDRDAYLREVERGRPALSFIPPGLPGHDPDDRAQAFDPSEARRLLSESRYAGHPELTGLRVYRSELAPPLIGARQEWLTRQWKTHLGVEVVALALSSVALQELQRRPETRAPIFTGAWCADYPHQQNWLTTLFDSGQTNFPSFRWVNARFDELVRQADRELETQKADRLYAEASRLLSADAGGAWIAHQVMSVLKKPWVGGLNIGPLDAAGGYWSPGDVYVTKRKPR